MATQTLKVLKDMRYGTRMLRAGDTVDMKGPDVRLYTALGAVGPRDADGSGRIVRATPVYDPRPATKRAPRKAATRKRAAKKAK
jgi:hypothetical protein